LLLYIGEIKDGKNIASGITLFRGLLDIALSVVLFFQPDKTRVMLGNLIGVFWLASGTVSLRWGTTGERACGATVRTSHMTGIVTDLGILFGQRMRGKSVSLWRVQLLSALFAAFLCGGILAGIVFQSWGYRALWISVIGAAAAGLSYSSYYLFGWLLRLGARENGGSNGQAKS